MKIGIVGNGFVGSSVAFGFSTRTGCDAEVKIYDKDSSKATHTLEQTINDSDYVFVSVPTPSNSDGSISLDIIYDVFEEIHNVIEYTKPADSSDTQPVILLRSTVTPGTTRKLQKKYPVMRIVFNPEFLTERSAKFDFINQSRFIIGGTWGDSTSVERLFKWRFGEYIPVIKTNFETAELIKYMNNCFFATKVSFLNEMYQIAEKCGANWDEAVEGFVRDGRVGHSHMNVPGTDGKLGFGGSCFPKDIQAMINFAKSLGINPTTLKGAWKTNLEVRPEKDWEELKGRAVVDNE
jgi:UDPglucose 6-dehydrogenase